MAEGKTQDWVMKEVIFVLPTSVHILVLCHDRIHLMVLNCRHMSINWPTSKKCLSYLPSG